MTRLLAAAALALAAAASAPAASAPAEVAMPGQFYAPRRLDVLLGTTVVWRNNDTVAHRIVLNDNANADTGNIAPGASSRAIELPASGANYHCTIHPGMIGSVESASGQPAPPCTGQYC